MQQLTQFTYIIQQDDNLEPLIFTAPLLQQAGENMVLLEINTVIRISKIDVDRLQIHGYTIGNYEP